MQTKPIAPDEWSLIKKFAFRFFFVFFILYIFLTPNDIIPYSYILHRLYMEPCNNFIAWVTINILHLAGPGTDHVIGTTDTTFGYLTILFISLTAFMGSVIWMITERKTANDKKRYDVLIVVLRYFLAITWIAYGSIKITRIQFPPIAPDILLKTYGNSSPRELAWAFMGYSSGFNYFMGLTEYAIGLLLFFRRTSLLGSILSFGALVNIMAFDYFFDVNVKLLATVLMLMTLFLLSRDIKRLINFLFFNKTTGDEESQSYRFKEQWKNKTLIILKYAFILYLLFFDLRGEFARAKKRGIGNQKPPLYGIYEVKTFIRNKDTVKLLADTTRWNKLIISSFNNAGVMLMNDSLKHFEFSLDTVKKKIELYVVADTANKYVFTYTRPKADMLIMQGNYKNDSLEIKLQQYDLNKFPLMNNHFRWIIDRRIKVKR